MRCAAAAGPRGTAAPCLACQARDAAAAAAAGGCNHRMLLSGKKKDDYGRLAAAAAAAAAAAGALGPHEITHHHRICDGLCEDENHADAQAAEPDTLRDADPANWAYRVEGALHMVFAYRGTHPTLDARVLRVATAAPSSSSVAPLHEHVVNNKNNSEAANPTAQPPPPPPPPSISGNVPAPADAHRFVRHVFGVGHLAPFAASGFLVRANHELVLALAEAAAPSRPPRRAAARSVVVPQPLLLVQPDCARLFTSSTPAARKRNRASTTLCVEIKPKAALTSVSRLVPKAMCDALDKFSTLAYAIKNYAGSPAESADPLPRYSPADLLSGDQTRIAHALDVLRQRRAHALRVFYDGEVALADDLPITVIGSAVSGDFEMEKPDADVEGRTRGSEADPFAAVKCAQSCDNFVSAAAGHGVPVTSKTAAGRHRDQAYESPLCKEAIAAAALVLAQQRQVVYGILNAQKRDYVDTIGAEKLWMRLVSCLGGDLAAEAAVWNGYFAHDECPQIVDAAERAREHLSYKDSAEARALHSDKLMREAEEYVETMPPAVVARVLADYMVASVVKDCSIMVSMSPRPPDYVAKPGEKTVRLQNGQQCLCKVSVVDLEPKPVSKILTWATRDRERAVRRYRDAASSGCVDDLIAVCHEAPVAT